MFERGHEDLFHITALNLGRILSLTVWHDGESIVSGWKLDNIMLHDDGHEISYFFPCYI